MGVGGPWHSPVPEPGALKPLSPSLEFPAVPACLVGLSSSLSLLCGPVPYALEALYLLIIVVCNNCVCFCGCFYWNFLASVFTLSCCIW